MSSQSANSNTNSKSSYRYINSSQQVGNSYESNNKSPDKLFDWDVIMPLKHIDSWKKSFKCEVNGKYFAFQCFFYKSQNMPTGENPFDFIQCDNGISLKVTFVDHPRIHNGEEPLNCNWSCDASFAQISSLVNHQRTHSGEKLYKSDLYGKYVAFKSNFINHHEIHSGKSYLNVINLLNCFKIGKSSRLWHS